jgi:pteridine reductase
MVSHELRGKTALITGSARRIGRHTALALAKHGMNLVIHYNRSEAEAHGLRDELHEQGLKAFTVQADFRDPRQVETLIDRALELAGSLDLLVNNASNFDANQVGELDYDTFVQSLTVNAWAPFALARSYCQKIGHGQVINLIDSRVDDYDFKHTGYIVAKTCLLKMTEMLALQYAPQVAVNGIMPGLILPPPGKDEAFLQSLADTVPLQRHGDPEDIAAAVVFLARSSFMTGALIHVDGGRRLKEYHHGSSYPDK